MRSFHAGCCLPYVLILVACCAKPKDMGQGGLGVLQEKPYLTLHIHMENCRYDVTVNHVSVASDPNGRSLDIEVPVNQWLRSGRNETAIALYPWPKTGVWPANGQVGPTANAIATLQVRNIGDPTSASALVTRVSYSGASAVAGRASAGSTPSGKRSSTRGFEADDSGDVVVGETLVTPMRDSAGVIISQTLDLQLPLPIWAFFSSDEIPLIDDMNDTEFASTTRQLLERLQVVWDALNHNAVDRVLPLFEERNRELDAAFFKEPGSTARDLALSLQTASKAADMKLIPLSFDRSQLVVEDNRRLARLVNTASGEAVLAFEYTDQSATQRYPIVFRRSGNQWIVCR
jgi:hypothetical protein